MDYSNQIGKHILDLITKDKEVFYIICPYHIGDLIISGGLAHAINLPENKKFIKIVAIESLRKMGVHFSSVKEIEYIPNLLMNEIKNYIIKFGLYRTEQYIYGHFKLNAQNQIIWNNKLDFLQRYKDSVYELPMDTNLEKPVIANISDEDIERLNSKYVLSKKYTVVLMPYAYSIEMLDNNFWIILARSLKSKGFTVYTNVGNANESPIEDTLPIMTTFSELFYISDKIHCFIGLRSGILDFLANTKANIFCISYLEHWWYDLKRIFPNSNCQTFYYGERFIFPINNYIQNYNNDSIDMSLQISIRLKYLDNCIICLDVKSLIESILKMAS